MGGHARWDLNPGFGVWEAGGPCVRQNFSEDRLGLLVTALRWAHKQVSPPCARAQLCDILSGARALLVRPSTTLSSCSLTDVLRRTRQTPDCRMTTTQLRGRSRVCGDAPGACAHATLPTALPIALPLRVLPPPVVSRVVIPSRGCAYPVLSIALAHSGRLNVSTALREYGTSRHTCGHTGIA